MKYRKVIKLLGNAPNQPPKFGTKPWIEINDEFRGTYHTNSCRGGSRATATSKMERFVIIVNDWKPLTIITNCSSLDIAAALDPPLSCNV